MEGWKDGRMEGWKDGRMEGWKDGRMEGWKDERVEGWKDGRMEGWKGGRVEVRNGCRFGVGLMVRAVRTLCMVNAERRTANARINGRYRSGGLQSLAAGEPQFRENAPLSPSNTSKAQGKSEKDPTASQTILGAEQPVAQAD